MHVIEKIVVPVDFGKQTEKLAKFALDIAGRLSAKVNFIHVTDLFREHDAMVGTTFLAVQKQIQDTAEERMKNLVDDYSDRGPCTGKVTDGEVVEDIVAYAEQEGAGMIIISTHGAKGLEKILLGSVAERVVKKAHCPVLVYNPYK